MPQLYPRPLSPTLLACGTFVPSFLCGHHVCKQHVKLNYRPHSSFSWTRPYECFKNICRGGGASSTDMVKHALQLSIMLV